MLEKLIQETFFVLSILSDFQESGDPLLIEHANAHLAEGLKRADIEEQEAFYRAFTPLPLLCSLDGQPGHRPPDVPEDDRPSWMQ